MASNWHIQLMDWMCDEAKLGRVVHPTAPSSAPLSAATPQTGRDSPHMLASLIDSIVLDTTTNADDASYFTASVEAKDDLLSDPIEHIIKPTTEQSSQLQSPLLSKLPRELRDQIYREAVVEDIEVPIQVAHYGTKAGKRRGRLELEHALMLVCKQIRQEVADIYYLENIFRITNDLFHWRPITKLTLALRPWAERIKRLEVSHEFRSKGLISADIDFSVSTFQGRIMIEPLTFVPCTWSESNQRIRVPNSKMCYCEVSCLTVEHGDGNILDWMWKYVELVEINFCKPKNYVPHCWTCGGDVVLT